MKTKCSNGNFPIERTKRRRPNKRQRFFFLFTSIIHRDWNRLTSLSPLSLYLSASLKLCWMCGVLMQCYPWLCFEYSFVFNYSTIFIFLVFMIGRFTYNYLYIYIKNQIGQKPSTAHLLKARKGRKPTIIIIRALHCHRGNGPPANRATTNKFRENDKPNAMSRDCGQQKGLTKTSMLCCMLRL